MAEGGLGLNLSCSICFEEFKTPKMLSCGHTFCCQCLSKMVDRYSSLQCPTCRRDVSLPGSGKVEDFPTNFALMNLIPDQALNKSKIKKTDQPRQNVDSVCQCPKHKTPMEFYCKSCEIQVCSKCLLKDHKPDKHDIVTASDIATNLSNELQNLKKKLQHCMEEEKSLGEKIFKGLDYHQQDKERLEQEIRVTLEREQEKLKKAAENLLNELNKKVEDHAGTFADLKTQHSNHQAWSNQIDKNCKDLNKLLQKLDLSQSRSEIERVSKRIETLKDAVDSLKIACQSTPTKVGLNFMPASSWHLGKLTKVSSKPMILKSTDFTNKDCSQKIKTHTQRKDDNVIKDESCEDLHDQQNELGSDLNMPEECYDLDDEWHLNFFGTYEPSDRESAHKNGNTRFGDQKEYVRRAPYRCEYDSYPEYLDPLEQQHRVSVVYWDAKKKRWVQRDQDDDQHDFHNDN